MKSQFYLQAGTTKKSPRYARMRAKTRILQQRHGDDRKKMWKREQEETPPYEEGREYTNRQLELIADQLLREDARSEICRLCGGRGDETGQVRSVPQGVTDDQGRELYLDFPEYTCANDHSWYQGEGEARGIGGDAPILFEEHMASRKRREIFPTNGVPDPSIVAGIYNRTHPQGRKVNSEEQRKRNGASFFR